MVRCPNCGVENRKGARFCKECRLPLTQSPVQESPPQPAYEPPPPPAMAYEPPPEPKKSNITLIVGAVIGVVILCCFAVIVVAVILGLTGAYQDILSFLPFFSSQPATIKAIPADAGLFSTVNLSVRDLEGFQHLADVYEDAYKDEVKDGLEEIEDTYDISFEDDVQPWIGPEMSIAILNLKDVAEDGDEPVMVIAAMTRDRKASDAFLEKLREAAEDEGDVEEKTYKDVTFYVQETSGGEESAAFGTVGNLVVLTSSADAMEEVIDTYKGEGDSLTKNEHYAELMKELPSGAAMYLFIDMEDLGPALEDMSYPPYGMVGGIGTLGTASIIEPEAYKAIGMAVTLDKEGVQIDTAATFDPDEMSSEAMDFLKTQGQANPGHILEKVPDDALAFVSARDLATAWKAYIELNPDFEDQLKEMSEYWGVEVDEEFFAWATGEFTLALTSTKDEVELFAIFEVSDPDAALDAMDELANDIESKAGIKFEKETIGGVEMQVLIDPYSKEIMLGYGLVENYMIIGITKDGLEKGVEGGTPVIDSETFKKLQARLPQKNNGYVYVNIKELADETDGEFGPWLEPIEAIAMAQAATDPGKGVTKSTIYIYIP
jgi:hypothetical protein